MELWTLGELAERVEAALADSPGPVNGRVRAVPDQRAIRWYTTTGLIDRPAQMRGRTALYSRRHLLQLVAIKRRQSQGHALAEIQAELTGAPDEALEPIAALPPEPAANHPSEPPSAPADAAAPERTRFWTDRPAGADVAGEPVDTRRASTPSTHLGFVVRVGDGVRVVVDGVDGGVVDVERLVGAAEPLVAELVRQRLLPQASGDEL
ncbi:MerR family transcriptional regulator [Kribbella sp. NPDC023855]|uniref:MerR family transcriptional regulator n=1 Tax=Kribbella sp. NPDC023855 TaxID=3154698 RepID=UPI0033C1BBF4